MGLLASLYPSTQMCQDMGEWAPEDFLQEIKTKLRNDDRLYQ